MKENKDLCIKIEISDDDIFEAMKDMQGYLDITPGDLKEIYKFAYRHAYDRIIKSVMARDIMTRMGAGDKMNFMAVIAECLKGREFVSMPIGRKKAEDIMTSPAITVTENTAVSE